MKNIVYKSIIMASLIIGFSGCNKWLEPTTKNFDIPLTKIAKDDAYYKALREYKASKHSVSFGWFSEWNEGKVSTSAMLSAVPDSMDIISLWNNAHLTPTKKADLDFVTKVKGTKVVLCSFIAEVGVMFTPKEHSGTVEAMQKYWGWKNGDEEAIHNSIKKWAKTVADSLNIYGFSGIDIDYETSEYGGSLCRSNKYFKLFVEEMGKYIGPQSGTDKLFIIDGYFWSIPNPNEIGKYFNYFVEQAYKDKGPWLNRRISDHYKAFSSLMSEEEYTGKCIFTENLESAIDCLNGGYGWTDAQGYRWDVKEMPSLVGFADFVPANGFRKGGFGAFRFSNESVNNPPYKWMRKAIQQQNPAPGYKKISKKK